jgi:hypothetical protein
VVFLCGGAIDGSIPPSTPKMLRDVYYRHRKPDLVRLPFKIVLAEDANPLTADAGYADLLSFESDIAQVVGLIVLFVESAGSFAELGAFSALDTIAPSLLAVILDHYYKQESFIKNGPIKYLENLHGEDSILSIELAEIGVTNPSDLSPANPTKLTEALEDSIIYRLNKMARWRTFDSNSAGHHILLMTGLCQEYGALTQTEVKSLMEKLGVDLEPGRIKSYIYCAQLLSWVKLVRKGHQKYVVALRNDGQENALGWNFVEGVTQKDRTRWRSDIRQEWKKNEPLRYRAIAEVDVG